MPQLPIDLAQLADIIDLCRKKGVSSFQCGELKIEIREEAPPKRAYTKKSKSDQTQTSDDPAEAIPNDGPTMEELMFLSAGGEISEKALGIE